MLRCADVFMRVQLRHEPKEKKRCYPDARKQHAVAKGCRHVRSLHQTFFFLFNSMRRYEQSLPTVTAVLMVTEKRC